MSAALAFGSDAPVIGVVQLAFLGWGVHVLYEERPILSAFGFFRQEDDTSPYVPAQAVRPAAE